MGVRLGQRLACHGGSTPLRDSARFRTAIKSANDTLLTLGVSPANVRIAIENLMAAAQSIVNRAALMPAAGTTPL